MTTNGITVTIRNITIMVALCILIAFAFGCSHLHVTNTTADGRTFEAVGWSFCWDRNLEGLTFDYGKGTLEVINYRSATDKEAIARGTELIQAGTELIKTVKP